MTPWEHAQKTAEVWGGDPDDYISLHNWLDDTKQYTGDWTHRALRHHAAGVEWCIERFGHTMINSEHKSVPTKVIAEQHIREDCGKVPRVDEWLAALKGSPEQWMLRVPSKGVRVTTVPMELTDEA